MVQVKLICPFMFVAFKEHRMQHHIKLNTP
nr:MAG TPA: hypothetical protein [Caudoviricetes sp.]